MESITLKKYYVEQFELTPAIIREHLAFLASDNFIVKAGELIHGICCDNTETQIVEHQTKNGLRYTVECKNCNHKSVMATTELMANLSWFQKFSDWGAFVENPLFKSSIGSFARNIALRDNETEVYLLLELLAGLNVFNKLHDANKKRFEGLLSLKDKVNVDAVSVLIRSAQKSVADRLSDSNVSLKEGLTQRRLKGITDKIVSERMDRVSMLSQQAQDELSGIIDVFSNCFQNDKK